VEVSGLPEPASMLAPLTIASNGLAIQAQRAGEIASSIAATGATAPSPSSPASGTPGVRVGALPVGDPIENLVSLKEVELAYRMNAAVLSTASEMLETLLDAVSPQKR